MGEMSDYHSKGEDVPSPLTPIERCKGALREGLAIKAKQDAAKARFDVGIWTQRDGTPIAVKDMGDHHLLAARAMIARNGAIGEAEYANLRDMFLSSSGPSGEMAQDLWQHECDDFFDNVRVSPWIDVLDAEIKRRGCPCP